MFNCFSSNAVFSLYPFVFYIKKIILLFFTSASRTAYQPSIAFIYYHGQLEMITLLTIYTAVMRSGLQNDVICLCI